MIVPLRITSKFPFPYNVNLGKSIDCYSACMLFWRIQGKQKPISLLKLLNIKWNLEITPYASRKFTYHEKNLHCEINPNESQIKIVWHLVNQKSRKTMFYIHSYFTFTVLFKDLVYSSDYFFVLNMLQENVTHTDVFANF